MATKFESYSSGGDTNFSVWGSRWYAQTFTPSDGHTITSVKLYLARRGSPGTMTVSIKATSGGEPTGADLCSGTINANTFDLYDIFGWQEISFGAGASLSVNTKYAIVVRAPSGTVTTDDVLWKGDNSSPTYAGGNKFYSYDSGTIWTGDTGADCYFEDWGDLTFVAYPSDPTTRVTGLIHRYDRGVYNVELLFGDIISDFSIPNVDSSTTKAYQSKEELDKINNALSQGTPVPTPTAPVSPVQPTPAPTVTTPTTLTPTRDTGIAELTQYAKDILATPAGQAAIARQQGLAQGVEAVVTPYAIDVLRKNEQEATLLIQIQKMTQAAKATGITSYARGVLLKAIVDAKAQLKELYKQ